MLNVEEKLGTLEGPERAVAQALAKALEPQRGRAGAAFLAAVREGRAEQVSAAIALTRATKHGDREGHLSAREQRRAMWLWGGLPTALAACVAVAVGLEAFLGQPGGLRHGSRVVNAAPAAMEENVWTRNVDSGVVPGDAGPLRVLRQQVVRQRRWVDPRDGAVYTVTEPGEQVNYQAVKPF